MAAQKSVGTETILSYPNPTEVTVTNDVLDLVSDYAESTLNQLDELEKAALAFEKGKTDKDCCDWIKRILHKIKGESGVMGIQIMSSTYHEAEQAFTVIDPSQVPELLLKTRDWSCQVLACLTGHSVGGFDPISKTAAVIPEKKEVVVTLAKDIMKTNLLTVELDTNIYDAISMMVQRNVTGLPVLNRDLTPAGIISEKDVLQLLYDMQDSSKTVADFMTPSLVSFTPEDSITDICECLLKNNFRRVAILENGKLVGIVSCRNIIAANKAAFEEKYPERRKKKSKIFRASDVMKRGLLTVQKSSPIYEVIEFIIEHNVTGVPVVNPDMTVAGFVSEKDVLELSCNLENAEGTVDGYMTQQTHNFTEEDSLIDICDCLIANPFRRVTILDKNGRLSGIISRRDIIAFIVSRRSSTLRRRKSD